MTQLKNTTAVLASGDVGRWRSDLDALLSRIAPAFRRIETRQNAKRMVNTLMAHLERRNCWTLAEQAGEAGPWRFQHLLSRAKWDDAQIRAEVRAYVSEHLGAGDGLRVLVVDETGDVKKGTAQSASSGSTRGPRAGSRTASWPSTLPSRPRPGMPQSMSASTCHRSGLVTSGGARAPGFPRKSRL